MKKVLLILGVISSTMFADMLKIQAGGGSLYNTNNKGEYSYNGTINSIDSVTMENSVNKNYYLYADIRHPVPFIPNARIEYYDITNKGTTTVGTTFDNTSFIDGSLNQFKYRSIESIGYYRLPIPGVDIDLGGGLNTLEGSISLNDNINNSIKNYKKDIPFIYGNVHLDIPLSNIGLEANVKYNKNVDTKINFLESVAKFTYTLNSFNVIAAKYKIALEAGVKYTDNKFITTDNVNLHYKDTNAFGGINILFGSF
jgi:outer membrane protein